MTTLESYKSIWTLLDINPEVVIYFDSEQAIKTHSKELEKQLHKKEDPLEANQDDLSARVAQADPDSEYNKNLEATNQTADKNDQDQKDIE